MGYQRPCDAPISSSWHEHLDRNPPSSEPGTDYACAYSTPILAAETGTITDIKTSNSNATGRYITVRLDDGRTVRYLHLSEIWVGVGMRFGRGQALGLSGASANGSDWGVGAHVHTTLWPGEIWASPTIDFEAYAGDPTPPSEPPTRRRASMLYAAYRNDDGSIAVQENQTGPLRWISDVDEWRGILAGNPGVYGAQVSNSYLSSLFQKYGTAPATPPAHDTSSQPLSAPAWVAGGALIVLALIGIVQLVQSVVPG